MIESFEDYYKKNYETAKKEVSNTKLSDVLTKFVNVMFYYLVFFSFPIMLILIVSLSLKNIEFKFPMLNEFFNLFEISWFYWVGFFHVVVSVIIIPLILYNGFLIKRNKPYIKANMRKKLLDIGETLTIDLKDNINNKYYEYNLEDISEFESLNKITEFEITKFKKDVPKFNFAFLSLTVAITLGLAKLSSDLFKPSKDPLIEIVSIFTIFVIGLLVYFIVEKLVYSVKYHSKEQQLKEMNEFILEVILIKKMQSNNSIKINNVSSANSNIGHETNYTSRKNS